MGSVWLAQKEAPGCRQKAALKLPHAWLVSSELQQRFARERDILGSLDHPLIAKLYEAGVAANGRPYLAMEYVSGAPLFAHCDARRMDMLGRLEIFLQVLESVRYAHARNVIHRDLKPSNILMSADGQAHLLDFGIAVLLNETESALFPAAFTPSYAAPEQIAGEAPDAASDVYALGVMLYELVVGRRPYRVEPGVRAAMVRAVMEAPIDPPSKACTPEHAYRCGSTLERQAASFVGDLDAIVLKAIARERERRYTTVMEFADDIERYLDASSPLPRAYSRRARALRAGLY
jgi:serine/threonine protein kinase